MAHVACDEISACRDCLLFVANGDLPEDGDWSPDHIEKIWPCAEYVLVCGDTEQDDEFSWQPCECCGSRLGGSRHMLAALENT